MDCLQRLIGPIEVEKIVEELQLQVKEIATYKGRIGESAESLLSCIQKYERIAARAEEIFVIGQLLIDLDNESDKAQNVFSLVEKTNLEIINETQFILEEIKNINSEELEKFCQNKEELLQYKSFFQKLKLESFDKPDIDVVLSYMESIGQVFQDAFQSLIYNELPCPKILKNGSPTMITWLNFKKLLKHKDRKFRKAVYEKLFGSFRRFSNSLSILLNGHVKKEVFLAKIRGKETVLESVLNKNQIEQSMFDRWISQVHENIPLFQQLWKVRMKYIGIDDFHYYDLYAPVVPECFPTVTIEQATDIIYNACTPLGEEYQEVLKQAFQYVIYDEFLPSSYAVNIYNIHPIALVNFKGSLSDLLVLAHELGHVVHMKYTNQHNSFINSEVTDLSSEIAALTNELLVLEYLIETNKNVEQKRHLYNMLIHKFHNHIFRQTLLTEFEKKIYEHVENGMSLTGKFLSTQYSKLQAKYYGKSFVDSFSGNEWMSIPHLFSTFYMLIYPFAFYGALKIVEKVKSNQAISDHYAEFLSNRNSNLLKELFQEIQLDQEHHYKMLYELIATILNQYISVMGS